MLHTVLAGENQKSGPIGLAVILLLCVACYFLFRSMSRHLRNVRERFPDGAAPHAPPSGAAPQAAPQAPPPGAGTDVAGAAPRADEAPPDDAR